MDVPIEILIQIAYALGVGALVGLERSYHEARGTMPPPPEGGEAAPPDPEPAGEYLGLRTFAALA